MMSIWISVKDRSPINGEFVIVIAHDPTADHPNKLSSSSCRYFDNKRWVVDHFCESSEYTEKDVIFWMPFPFISLDNINE